MSGAPLHVSLLLVAVLVLGQAVRDASCAGSCGGGVLSDGQLLKQRRVQTIKSNILAQLGVSEAAVKKNTSLLQDEEPLVVTYYALRNTSEGLERERERQCQSRQYYAQPVTSFIGILTYANDLPTESRSKREQEIASESKKYLAKYNIDLDFDIPEDRTDISKADLLLYQNHSRTGPEYILCDEKQYIEISTVVEAIGVRAIIESRYIDVLDHGFQVFDITSAVKIWVLNKVTGRVRLEVNIYRYGLQQCALEGTQKPVTVEFFNARTGDKAPRVITISKNPAENRARSKRSTTNNEGVGFCNGSQVICCLKPLKINFKEDLGFNSIIMPPDFDANYCEGFCPSTSGGQLMTPKIFEYYSVLENPNFSVEPCCVGNKYSALDVLVMVDGNLVIEELQQVTVNSCRCS